MAKQTSIAKARTELSSLINQVAHGKERVILTSRGHPKAALVGLDDLQALEDLPTTSRSDQSTLDEADELVERIARRRQGVFVANSADDLAVIRNQGD